MKDPAPAGTTDTIQPVRESRYRKVRDLTDPQVPRDLRSLWNDLPPNATFEVVRVFPRSDLVLCNILVAHQCSRNYDHTHGLPIQAFTTAYLEPAN